MTTAINIKEAILDKESYFNIKRFKVGSIKVEKPMKILNVRDIKLETFKRYSHLVSKKERVLFENSRTFKASTIDRILDETDNDKIKQLLGYKKWATPLILTYTFSFNPFDIFGKLGEIEGFFSYYYTHSAPFLFVPNLKVKKTIKVKDPQTGKEKTKQIIQVSLEKYLEFVDWTVENLNRRNNKPIFVPLSLKFGMRDIKTLAEHYIKKEYFNIWIDFESSAPTTTNLGKIRQSLSIFEQNERLEDIIIYSTNLNREFMSSPTQERTPGTDPITTVIGSNLIGGNKSKGVPVDDSKKVSLPTPQRGYLLDYKARLFDETTYYYLHFGLLKKENPQLAELIRKKEHNILINTFRLSEELKNQGEYFLETLQIKPYLETKPMLKEYKDGSLLKTLFSPVKRRTKAKPTKSIDTPNKINLLSFLPKTKG